MQLTAFTLSSKMTRTTTFVTSICMYKISINYKQLQCSAEL